LNSELHLCEEWHRLSWEFTTQQGNSKQNQKTYSRKREPQ